MSEKRSAVSIIRGYLFQLKYSALKIMQANPSDIITVEGCEDLDIETEAGTQYIQIKYSDNIELYPGKLNGITKSMKAMIQRGIKPTDTLLFVQKKKEYVHSAPKFDPNTFNKKLVESLTAAQKPYVSKQPQSIVSVDPSYDYSRHYNAEFYNYKTVGEIQASLLSEIMQQRKLTTKEAVLLIYCVEQFIIEHLGEPFTKEEFDAQVDIMFNEFSV